MKKIILPIIFFLFFIFLTNLNGNYFVYFILSFVGLGWLAILINNIWTTTKRTVPISRLSFTDIAMAQSGIVKIVGKISADQLIYHRAEKQPCVYYHYAEYRKYRTHQSHRHDRRPPKNLYSYELLHNEQQSAQNIYIQDETGKIYLDPVHLVFDLHTFAKPYNKFKSDFTAEHHRTNEIHIEELLDQSYALAIGEVQLINGKKTLVKPKNHSYFVSSIEKISDLETNHYTILYVTATLLLSITLLSFLYLFPDVTNQIENIITTYFPNAWAFLLEQTMENTALMFIAFFVGCIFIMVIFALLFLYWLTQFQHIGMMISLSLILTQPVFIGLCIVQNSLLFANSMLWIMTFMTILLNILLYIGLLIWATRRANTKNFD